MEDKIRDLHSNVDHIYLTMKLLGDHMLDIDHKLGFKGSVLIASGSGLKKTEQEI